MTGFTKDGVFYVLDAWELPIMTDNPRIEISTILGNNAYEYTDTMLQLGFEVKLYFSLYIYIG